MENSVGFVNPGGPIGSTNGVMSTSVNFNDNSYYLNENDDLSVNYIKQSIEHVGGATYRQDTISDINRNDSDSKQYQIDISNFHNYNSR